MHNAADLRHRVTVFIGEDVERDDGETERVYTPLRQIWAKIVPAHGEVEPLEGDMERMVITHRVYIRTRAWPELTQDAYFTYRGQRYDVQYYMPVFNQQGWTEIGCEMKVEGE